MQEDDFRQLKEYLSKFLKVKVDFKEAGRAYYDGDHELIVTLMLEGKEISSTTTSLPNHHRESLY